MLEEIESAQRLTAEAVSELHNSLCRLINIMEIDMPPCDDPVLPEPDSRLSRIYLHQRDLTGQVREAQVLFRAICEDLEGPQEQTSSVAKA